MTAIVDIHLTPIGTDGTSLSSYIAEAEKVLRQYPELEVQLNPMSTTIQGDLETLLQVVRAMHEAPFKAGAKRVSTTIRIDDRRDKDSGDLQDRVESVQAKLTV